MTERSDNERRKGLADDILAVGHQLAELARAWLLLIQEEVRQEAKTLGRRIALAAALLVLFLTGSILFAIGLGRILDVWIGVEGIGFVIIGAFLILLLPLNLLIMTRRR